MKKRKKTKMAAKNTAATTTQSPREFLVSKGFTPGARGRFSTEMVKALQDAGYPVKSPKERSKVQSVPLS
jgi:hypothetical protein